MWRRSCARSGPASSRWPATSAARPDLPRCPRRLARYQITISAAGCSAAPRVSRARGRRCRRGGMASAGLNVAHQLAHGGPLPPRHLRSRDGRARRPTATCRRRRDHAGAASRCVRVRPYRRHDVRFQAIRHHALERRPWGHDGATRLSRPVPSSPLPPAPSPRFAGIKCESRGLEGTKGFPDKEEVPGSSPGSPIRRNPGIRCVYAIFWDLAAGGSARSGCSMGPQWGHRRLPVRRKSAPWFAPPSGGCGLGEHRPPRTERARRRALGHSPRRLMARRGEIDHLV